MHILNVICSYNEINYLPYVVSYYLDQGIDVHVIDNYSTDGTWEWLNDNNISCHQLDTNGEFNVNKQQKERKRTYTRKDPDWVIYGDSDEFIVNELNISLSLKDYIEMVDKEEYEVVSMNKYEFRNTGEERIKDDPRNVFFYYEPYTSIDRVHKNKGTSLEYHADFVMSNKKYHSKEFVIYNYGSTKDIEWKKEILERRKKAWRNKTLPRPFGQHLEKEEKRNWFWNKKDLKDIRKK